MLISMEIKIIINKNISVGKRWIVIGVKKEIERREYVYFFVGSYL